MNAALLGKLASTPQDKFSPGAQALAKIAREDVRARTVNPDIHTIADWVIDSFVDCDNTTFWAVDQWLKLPALRGEQFFRRYPRYLAGLVRALRERPDLMSMATSSMSDRDFTKKCMTEGVSAFGANIYGWSVIALMIDSLVSDPRAFSQRLRDGRLDDAIIRKLQLPDHLVDGLRETFRPIADTIDLILPPAASPATPPFVAPIQPWPIRGPLGDPRTIFMQYGSAVLSRAQGDANNYARVLDLIDEAVNAYKTAIPAGALDDFAISVGADWIRQAYIFALAWATSGFPLLRPTHKLAASLMATHVPKDLVPDIQPPFASFLVELPDGIVPSGTIDHDAEDGGRFPGHMREMVYTDRLVGIVDSLDGLMLLRVLHGPEAERKPLLCTFYPIAALGDLADMSHPDPKVRLLARLVLNCALELEDPRFKHARESGPPRPSAPKAKGGRPKDTLPTAWTFELRRDVKLDARAWVGDYIASKGASPSVQTLVRGHWKRQPFGPRVLGLRRSIHIEPYWRGPEDAPIVTRPLALAREE